MYQPKPVSELCPDPSVLGLSRDTRGWNGTHPVFAEYFNSVHPDVVIEVGSWYGQGTLHLASLFEGRLYCVDTWLGGIDHLMNEGRSENHVPRKHGYPTLYNQWLYNVASSPHAGRVFPIPQTSVDGLRILGHIGIKADIIVIDGSHQYLDVYADLQHALPLLANGGVMIMDDFRSHKGVFHAVLRFAHEADLKLRENGPFAVFTPR
jgi:hypothetical protein